jgi:hypothetical protein
MMRITGMADTKNSSPRLSASHHSAVNRRAEAKSKQKPFDCGNLFFAVDFFHAAEAVAACRFAAGASSPSQRTLTSFETPGSCIVTP